MRAKRAGKMWDWTVASKYVIIQCEWSEPEKCEIELLRANML